MKKKSFILYNDFQSTLDKLSDEQAGKLLKKIYSYVNNKEYEVDMIIDLVFEPIKTQLKRDENKYHKIIERNRTNGKKGGRPKKNPENPVGNLVTQNNPDEPKKADSVSVSVSGSGSESESESENIPTITEWIDFAFEYAKKYYKNDFVVSEIKVKSLLTNSYEHWERLNWKKVKDWKRTAQNKVRKENEKLKDWNIESKPNSLKKRSYDEQREKDI